MTELKNNPMWKAHWPLDNMMDSTQFGDGISLCGDKSQKGEDGESTWQIVGVLLPVPSIENCLTNGLSETQDESAIKQNHSGDKTLDVKRETDSRLNTHDNLSSQRVSLLSSDVCKKITVLADCHSFPSVAEVDSSAHRKRKLVWSSDEESGIKEQRRCDTEEIAYCSFSGATAKLKKELFSSTEDHSQSERDSFTTKIVDDNSLSVRRNDKIDSTKARVNDKIGSPNVRVNDKIGSPNVRVNDKIGSPNVRVNDKIGSPNVRVNDKIGSPKARVRGKIGSSKVRVTDLIDSSKVRVNDKIGSSKVRVNDKIGSPKARVRGKIGSSKVRVTDLIDSSKVRVNDKIGSSKVRVNDKIGSSKVRVNDKIGSSKVRVNDKIGSLKVRLNDKIGSSKVRVNDKFGSSKVRENDKIGSSKVRVNDKIGSLKVRPNDKIGSSKVRVNDNFGSSKVRENDKIGSQKVRVNDKIGSPNLKVSYPKVRLKGKIGSSNVTSNISANFVNVWIKNNNDSEDKDAVANDSLKVSINKASYSHNIELDNFVLAVSKKVENSLNGEHDGNFNDVSDNNISQDTDNFFAANSKVDHSFQGNKDNNLLCDRSDDIDDCQEINNEDFHDDDFLNLKSDNANNPQCNCDIDNDSHNHRINKNGSAQESENDDLHNARSKGNDSCQGNTDEDSFEVRSNDDHDSQGKDRNCSLNIKLNNDYSQGISNNVSLNVRSISNDSPVKCDNATDIIDSNAIDDSISLKMELSDINEACNIQYNESNSQGLQESAMDKRSNSFQYIMESVNSVDENPLNTNYMNICPKSLGSNPEQGEFQYLPEGNNTRPMNAAETEIQSTTPSSNSLQPENSSQKNCGTEIENRSPRSKIKKELSLLLLAETNNSDKVYYQSEPTSLYNLSESYLKALGLNAGEAKKKLIKMKCRFCPAKFHRSSDLLRHTRKHTGEKPFKCDICSITCKTAYNLSRHKKTHLEPKSHGCDTCGKIFLRKSDLRNHTLIHKGLKPYLCNICGKTFTTGSDYTRHSKIHTGDKPFKCKICKRAFIQKVNLKSHIAEVHSKTNAFKCEVCDTTFTRERNLKKHMEIHTGDSKYECETCGKAFACYSSMARHNRIHTGEKPYTCDLCGKAFSQNTHLLAHRRRHIVKWRESQQLKTPQSPNKWNFGKACRKLNLHEKKRSLPCGLCCKKFPRLYNLNRHQDWHIKSRTFSCEICSWLPSKDGDTMCKKLKPFVLLRRLSENTQPVVPSELTSIKKEVEIQIYDESLNRDVLLTYDSL